VLRGMEGEEKPMLGRRVVVYGGGNTAIDVARTAKRLGAEESIIVYRRTREKMPAHDFEVEEALQEGVMMKWLSTIKEAGEATLMVEKMALDENGFPQPTGEFETSKADSLVLALGQDVDLGLLNGVPGLKSTTASVQVGRHDDRPSGHFRRRRHGAGRAHRHGGRRPRQEGGANIDAWLRGETYAPPPKHEVAASTSSTPGTTPTRRRPCARCSTSSAARAPSRRCRAAWTRATPCSRRAAACPAATASSATTATASAPTTP
jgi:hypothetical protein